MNNLEIQFPVLFSSWFIFIVILLTVCLATGGFTLWLVSRKKTQKRKRNHRHHHHYRRQKNPSLAEAGGLPPPRDRNQPPGP